MASIHRLYVAPVDDYAYVVSLSVVSGRWWRRLAIGGRRRRRATTTGRRPLKQNKPCCTCNSRCILCNWMVAATTCQGHMLILWIGCTLFYKGRTLYQHEKCNLQNLVNKVHIMQKRNQHYLWYMYHYFNHIRKQQMHILGTKPTPKVRQH